MAGALKGLGRLVSRAAAALLLVASVGADALAAQLSVPVNVDYLVLDAAIRQRFYTAPGGVAEFWKGSDNCGHFRATDPRFSRQGTDVRLDTKGDLQAALALAGQCLNAMSWQGNLAATSAPRIEDFQLKFHVTDLNFYTAAGAPIGGTAFDFIKHSLIAELGNFTYDLRPYVSQLRELPDRLPPSAQVSQLKAVLNSLRLGPEVIAKDDGVSLTLMLDAPNELIQAPANPLSNEEKTAWQTAASNVEMLLTTVAERVHASLTDRQLGDQLSAIAADARKQTADSANKPPPDGDPLPLYRADWERLRMAIEAAAHRGALGDQTLPILGGVAAGDAVFAIDREAPGIGARLARVGLAQLATSDGLIASPSAP